MKATVFGDRRLAKQAGRFVWLSIDAEKERNAGFLERFPTRSYPTILVVDPAPERAVLRWYGLSSVKQLERLLDDARLAMALQAAPGAGPEQALARATRLHAEGRTAEAIPVYREALQAGGPGWERRPRTVEALVAALATTSREEECAATALAEVPGLPRGSSFASAASQGLACAVDAEEGAWREAARPGLEALVVKAAAVPDLLADDRAYALAELTEARQAAGDEKGARRWAGRLWSFLTAEARRTPNAELRASLDSFRVTAALALGDPARAVPALRASEKALPDDYNPPFRLAVLYREMARNDDAVAAADRALARAYGPRKLRIYDTKARSLEKKGDRAGLEATLSEAVDFAGKLPEVQAGGTGKLVERMRAQLASLGQPIR